MEADALLAYVVQAFEALEIPYMLTGSMASIYYGEPRLTNDIDLVADPAADQFESLLAWFPAEHYYRDAETVREAIRLRRPFNILHPASGLKVDVMVCRTRDFSRVELRRRQRVELLPGLFTEIARPEDVILAKLEFYREGGSEKHLRDIAGILAVSGSQLDQSYLTIWANRLGLEGLWRRVRDTT